MPTQPSNLQRKAALRLADLFEQMGSNPWDRMNADPAYKQNFMDNFGGAIKPGSVMFRTPYMSVEPPMNKLYAALSLAADTVAKPKGQPKTKGTK